MRKFQVLENPADGRESAHLLEGIS